MKRSSQNKKLKSIRLIIILSSLIIYIISLTQDAVIYNDHNGSGVYSSIEMLLMGSTAILGGGPLEWFVWQANPIFLLAIILFLNRKKFSLYLSTYASVVGLSFMLWDRILVSESGHTASITFLVSGYWLWVLSMSFLTIGIFYYFKLIKKESTPASASF